MGPNLNEMEEATTRMLLAGDDPDLEALREQLQSATVVDREFTGVGFFASFAVDDQAPRCASDMVLDDVLGDVAGLEHSASFHLFVRSGRISFLECAITDETWPAEAVLVRAYYVHPEYPGSTLLVETDHRDLAYALGG
jgi:hypothetical protein